MENYNYKQKKAKSGKKNIKNTENTKNTKNTKNDYTDLLQIDFRQSYEKKPSEIKKIINGAGDIIKKAAGYIFGNKILTVPVKAVTVHPW